MLTKKNRLIFPKCERVFWNERERDRKKERVYYIKKGGASYSQANELTIY